MSLRKLKEQVQGLQTQLNGIIEIINTMLVNDNEAFRTIDHVPKVFVTVTDVKNIVKYISSDRWYYRAWSISSSRFCTSMTTDESDVLTAINHADVVYKQEKRESISTLPDDFLLFSSALEQQEDSVVLFSYDYTLNCYQVFSFKNNGFESKPSKSMLHTAVPNYIKAYDYIYPLVHARVTE